jgi:hypothetical protein
MIPAGDLGQRLRTLIKVTALDRQKRPCPLYELVLPPNKAIVVEAEMSGEAEIACELPEGCVCIQWRLPTGLFEFLQQDKNADGAFVVQRADGAFEAHIMECKKTVDQKKWSDISQQMRWTLSKLLAISGALGLTLERAVLYTAFRSDKLSREESPNPAAAKRTISPPDEQSEVEAGFNEARQQQLEWERDQIHLRGFEGTFPHCKVHLDGQGRGAIRFDAA